MWRAWWVLPVALGVHAGQLWLSAQAWRGIAGPPPVVGWWRIRWVREAVNSMLPVAQIGGNLVGIGLLARAGLPLVQAIAATVLDLTAEAASQAAYTLGGLALLASMTADRHWLPWFGGGAALLLAGVAGFMAAQRLGLLRLVEALAARAGFARLDGLHAETMRLAHSMAVLRAGSLHLVAWMVGTAETALALAAMGTLPSLGAAAVIECLGMAIRSAGFAVPGALGVQETGLVLVSGLFGIPADTAVALSMVKRARELVVGGTGLLAWQWSGATPVQLARSDRQDERRT